MNRSAPGTASRVAASAAALLCLSCAERYELRVSPSDAVVGAVEGIAELRRLEPGIYGVAARGPRRSVRVEAAGHIGASLRLPDGSARETRTLSVELQPVRHRLRVETVDGRSEIALDGIGTGTATLDTEAPEGARRLVLRREGYRDQEIDIDLRSDRSFALRHQKDPGPWRCVGVFRTGRQPKQVAFTPDGRKLIVTLLDDAGFDLIDPRGLAESVRIAGPEARKRGYVEPLLCPERNSFWVSQMTADQIHEYRLPSAAAPKPILIRSLPSRGVWPKVMARDGAYRFLAVSNWVSSTVVVFDYGTGDQVAVLRGLDTPRGLAFSKDGSALFVCSYDGGKATKFDTASWRETAEFRREGASFRHAVLSPDGKELYLSDMGLNYVYRLTSGDLSLVAAYRTGSNPNTIALSPDGGRLFVSCRGPNNPESYLLRSPVDGEVRIIDTRTGKTETTLAGGNQPTGLALSPDGKTLAFTDFLDDLVEVYELRE